MEGDFLENINKSAIPLVKEFLEVVGLLFYLTLVASW